MSLLSTRDTVVVNGLSICSSCSLGSRENTLDLTLKKKSAKQKM